MKRLFEASDEEDVPMAGTRERPSLVTYLFGDLPLGVIVALCGLGLLPMLLVLLVLTAQGFLRWQQWVFGGAWVTFYVWLVSYMWKRGKW